MIQNLLADGRIRVLETLQRGYAPSHFSHNLELIFAKDSRSSASVSMKTKIAKFSEQLETQWRTFPMDVQALSEEGRYVNFSGARYEVLSRLPDLLLCGMESSRKYQEEKQKTALLSTALKIFVPTNPNQDDADLLLPVGVVQVWSILHELGVVE
ncbi:hypothetical protein TrVFT333_007439 [Trichoderma virens FT-333]|nr:hypothetical protein TrVFT333_007439 [Trichoderma virens FT-333]